MKTAAALAFLLVAASTSARADDTADAKAEAAARIDSAKPKLARGGYFDAVADLKKAVAADPTNVEAATLLAGAWRDTGEYRKAAELLVPFDKSAATLAMRAEILLLVGDDAGADAAAKAALALDADALGALYVVGRVQENAGDRAGAVKTYVDVNHRWVATSAEQETDDVLLADARAELRIFRITNEYGKDVDRVVDRLETLVQRSPDRVDAFVACGDLFMLNISQSHGDIEALKWYGKALDQNPHYAPALFGKARQKSFRYDEIDAAKTCEEQVLRENPSYVPALLFLAKQALGDGDYGKAQGLIDRAVATNPSDAESRAARAALLFLRGDESGFDAETGAILAKDKFASCAWSVLGHVLEEQRRFDEALKFAEKAVAADPLDWDAYFLAGRNALNVGDDAKAEKYLKAAEKGDPFENLYRRNFIELFNATRNFTVRKDAKFVLRMPPNEEEAYYRLLRSRMGDSIEMLQKKWGFRVAEPTYVLEFEKQEDFATRTIGLPGFPALGACFGQVVTLDSPRAGPPGMFMWHLVEHHELAHVVTLQLSKGRVPRWLTEGISVYEERKFDKSWWREYERQLIDAIASDEVLTLKDINGAFRDGRVMFAYYQGGLMCEFIERDFGFAKLREMVRLYGEGLSTDDVVRKALGIEPAQFDARFLAYAKDYVKDLRVFPHPTKAKTDRLKRALRGKPNDAEGWILLCEGALGQGDNAGALSALANAAKLLPDDGRIPALRAMSAWRENRSDLAVKHAEEAISKGADYYELQMTLAAFYADEGHDPEKAKAHWRRAIELFPLQDGQRDPRLLLARQLAAEGEKNLDEVMALLRAHVDLDENDLFTRKSLAEMYAQHGRVDDELAMFEQMRDIAPLPNGGGRAPGDAPRPGGGLAPSGAGWPRDAALAVHERLAEMYMDRKRYADAELAWSCAVGVARMDLGPKGEPAADSPTVATLLASHGESLHLLGRDDEARSRADEALRMDPQNDAAKKLADSLPH